MIGTDQGSNNEGNAEPCTVFEQAEDVTARQDGEDDGRNDAASDRWCIWPEYVFGRR
jgi:hypothetical protein